MDLVIVTVQLNRQVLLFCIEALKDSSQAEAITFSNNIVTEDQDHFRSDNEYVAHSTINIWSLSAVKLSTSANDNRTKISELKQGMYMHKLYIHIYIYYIYI